MTRRPTLLLAGLAPLATTVLLATPAHADPAGAKDALPLTVTCDNGRVYDVVSNGNGSWTPAHDLASSSTLVPLAFGETTFTITDANGTVLDSETQPASTKGQSGTQVRATATSCSYTGSATDPESGTTFTLSGTVDAFVTPVH